MALRMPLEIGAAETGTAAASEIFGTAADPDPSVVTNKNRHKVVNRTRTVSLATAASIASSRDTTPSSRAANTASSKALTRKPPPYRYVCESCGAKFSTEKEAFQHGKDHGMGHSWILAVNPEIGDHLVRWDGINAQNMPEHHGVCISERDFFGEPMIAHFVHKRGVVSDTLSDFAEVRVEVGEREHGALAAAGTGSKSCKGGSSTSSGGSSSSSSSSSTEASSSSRESTPEIQDENSSPEKTAPPAAVTATGAGSREDAAIPKQEQPAPMTPSSKTKKEAGQPERGAAASNTTAGARSAPESTNSRKTSPATTTTVAVRNKIYLWAHDERLEKRRSQQRCVHMVGKHGFHGLYNNCEHFASWAVIGEKKSRQLWALGGGVTGVSALWHIAGYMAGGAIGFAVAHGVFVVCKWTGIVYLGSDAAEHHWDSLTRVASLKAADPPKKCCLCQGKQHGGGPGSCKGIKRKTKGTSANVSTRPATSAPAIEGASCTEQEDSSSGDRMEPFLTCTHGACLSCLKEYVKNGGPLICPHPDCWEPLPPDLICVLAL
eukprot:CAMPEP_0178993610 /NCGR_PEP_ID=MMETSP0795-20121207/6797_1 /TAXON_ID=88552 /ORGANISM="Amoebophrya sp., Strain Ameob2" /LENGTH=548 /DNA_ID=CAMNT_0020685685 /DNA_START=95 /DNA_END=1741 /DNA_ORIENTATION=+